MVVPKPWLGAMPFRNGVVTNCGAGANCSSTVDAGVYVPPSTDQVRSIPPEACPPSHCA